MRTPEIDPFSLCGRESVMIQAEALRLTAEYLERFPSMIRAGQGEAAEALSAVLGPLPSEWNPEDIAPALFRVAALRIAAGLKTNPEMRAAFTEALQLAPLN